MMHEVTPENAIRYLPQPLESLRIGTSLPSDIYVRNAQGNYRRYARAHSPVDRKLRVKVRQRGIDTVYVRGRDTEAFYDYIEENLRRIIERENGRATEGESAAFIYQSADRLMRHLWEEPAEPDALERVSTAVEAAVATILRNENALWSILHIAGHDYYTFTHGINVSAIMIAACKLILGLDGADLLQVGLGAMLHDIGKKNVSGDILKKPGSLSREEFQDIMKHPLWGIEMAEGQQTIRHHARSIIVSHHERYEGGGYPAGVPSRELDEPSRMAKIVDVYDALTTHRPYGQAAASPDALRIMRNGMDGHFDRRLLGEFVAFMGFERN